MQKKQNNFITILENFTLLMIVFVLIQTFFEDFSLYIDWPIYIINKIILSAFIFDAFFTIEFIVRLIAAISKKKGVDYFFYKNGWIDFLASIPLLLLISGPVLLSQVFNFDIFSFGFINTFGLLKIIKAIRVARILRLLRVLKIFGKIKNVHSTMAQRHISTISTIVVGAIILFLVIISIFQETQFIPSRYDKMIENEQHINETFKKLCELSDEKNIINILKLTPKNFKNIIKIQYKDETIYKSKNIYNEKYQYHQAKDNEYTKTYTIISPTKLLITFWRDEYHKIEALYNMLNFSLIIFVLILIIIIYTRHFALTVSDPVYVMRMGFEKKDYTLAVKIQKHYKDDDLFLLANDYNSRWLPAKIRKLSETKNTESKLSFNDVFKK